VVANAARTLLTTGALAVLVGTAGAQPAGDPSTTRAPSAGDKILAPPPTYQANHANIAEHLGSKLPLDATFRTSDGKLVRLSDVFTGDLPTILTFNYADCPMLCNQQLNGLVNALPEAAKPAPIAGATKDIAFVLGQHYRIVTIDLEPSEPLDKASRMRKRYMDRTGVKDASAWTFLVAAIPGDGSQIRRVADAVGFSYTYLPDRAEWAHPAAFIFVSSAGAVTRYVYGIDFQPGVLRQSIFQAGRAEPATSSGFLFRCYHYDPGANDHSRAGVLALRLGAASCVLLLAGFGIVLFVRRSNGSRKQRGEPGEDT